MAYGRSLSTEEEPDGGQEGDEQGQDEQHEESVRRPTCGCNFFMEVVHRLVELTDLLFRDLVWRRAGGGAGAEEKQGDQGNPD